MSQFDSQPGADAALPETPFPITLTAKASDKVKEALVLEKLENHGLRVGVMGGGCNGLEYLLDFNEGPSDEDFTCEQHGVRVFIDPYSAAHLEGTTVDFVETLQKTGFKFENPNVVRTCGCGSSFQT